MSFPGFIGFLEVREHFEWQNPRTIRLKRWTQQGKRQLDERGPPSKVIAEPCLPTDYVHSQLREVHPGKEASRGPQTHVATSFIGTVEISAKQ